MGRAQELFDQATKAYDRSIDIIRRMDEVFQNAAFKHEPGRRYDTRITLAQFDMILQATLLSMALSDGNFDRLEQQFVDKITDYGDLLNYLRQDSKGQLDLTWSQVASLRSDTQAALVKALPVILDKLCDSFVKPLALVDKVVDQVDFLEQLEKNVVEICVCMSFVDGNSDQGEKNICAKMVNDLLIVRWRKYMR